MRKSAVQLRLFLMMMFLISACGTEQQSTPAPVVDQNGVPTIVIRPVGDQMRYAIESFSVKSGSKLRIVMENTATMESMIHNVAILKAGANIQDVGMAALSAGQEKNYIPDHPDLLFTTPQTPPGEKSEITFTVPPPGDYPYICTYPGHWMIMKGVMHSTP